MKNVIQCYRVLDPDLIAKTEDQQSQSIEDAFAAPVNIHIHDADEGLYYVVRVLSFDDIVLEKLDPESDVYKELIKMLEDSPLPGT